VFLRGEVMFGLHAGQACRRLSYDSGCALHERRTIV
jgi:hypothetical protein